MSGLNLTSNELNYNKYIMLALLLERTLQNL